MILLLSLLSKRPNTFYIYSMNYDPWIKTDLTVKPSPPYQYEVLFMTPIYLIKNTVFAAMKHFFTNKWRMWGPRSLRAYLRTKTSISGCHGPRSVSRTVGHLACWTLTGHWQGR